MEQLRKVVAVGCLTYVLYGLISWFQLGVFLPPLPIKPFIFLGFAAFGIYHAFQNGLKIVDSLFFLWLIIFSISDQHFMEFFFVNETIHYFQEYLEIYFTFIAVILFVLFNVLVIFGLSRVKQIYNIYFLILAILTVTLFTYPRYIGLAESSIVLGLIYLITNRFSKYDFGVSIERIITLITGVALVEFVQWSILVYSK